MFKIGQTEYELHYNLKRVDLLERALGTSVMAMIRQSQGLITLSQLKTCLMYGLRKKGADVMMELVATEPLIDKIFEKGDYEELCKAVIVQLSKDCHFLFPSD